MKNMYLVINYDAMRNTADVSSYLTIPLENFLPHSNGSVTDFRWNNNDIDRIGNEYGPRAKAFVEKAIQQGLIKRGAGGNFGASARKPDARNKISIPFAR
jgi:hypothetical protein